MRNLCLLLLAPLVFCACAQTRSVTTPIYRDRNLKISLHKVVDTETSLVVADNSHPAAFEVDELGYILGRVRYEEKGLFGWAAARAVFSADEIYRITPHLVEAFAKATPGGEVIFTSRSIKAGALFSSRKFTNGRMFVKGSALNCLFANINVRDEVSDAYAGDPRKVYGGASSRLVTNEWQSLVEGGGGVYYNWIEIEIEKALAEKAGIDSILTYVFSVSDRRLLRTPELEDCGKFSDWVKFSDCAADHLFRSHLSWTAPAQRIFCHL